MTEQLYHLLYRLPLPPHRSNPTNKPMQILALGLPRSGTDSLHSAWLILRYKCVWHGFDLPSTPPDDCAIWVPFLQAKAYGKDTPGQEFDSDFRWAAVMG
jgi:hypothetical protein